MAGIFLSRTPGWYDKREMQSDPRVKEFFQARSYERWSIRVAAVHDTLVPEEVIREVRAARVRAIVILHGSAGRTDSIASAAFDQLDAGVRDRIGVLGFSLPSANDTFDDWVTLLKWLQTKLDRMPESGIRKFLLDSAGEAPNIARLCGLESHAVEVRELAALRLAALFLNEKPRLRLESKVAIGLWTEFGNRPWDEQNRKRLATRAQEQLGLR